MGNSKKKGAPLWYIKAESGDLKLYVSPDSPYSFTFTSWEPQDEEDEFEKWVRSEREAAGIEVPSPASKVSPRYTWTWIGSTK